MHTHITPERHSRPRRTHAVPEDHDAQSFRTNARDINAYIRRVFDAADVAGPMRRANNVRAEAARSHAAAYGGCIMKIRTAALVLPLFLVACSPEQTDRVEAAGDRVGDGMRDAGSAVADFTERTREDFAVRLEQGRVDVDARITELRAELQTATGAARESTQNRIDDLVEFRDELPDIVRRLRDRGADNLDQLRENTSDALSNLSEKLKR